MLYYTCIYYTFCVRVICIGKTLAARNGTIMSIDSCDVPTYRPTAEQCDDVIAYIESISSEAQRYGMCRIIPPPDSRKVCLPAKCCLLASHSGVFLELCDRCVK